MTVKLVVLYTQPDDPAAFEEHYLGVHMPLAGAVPGLQRAESGLLTAALDGGGQTFYRHGRAVLRRPGRDEHRARIA